jgi:hypothetical protein
VERVAGSEGEEGGDVGLEVFGGGGGFGAFARAEFCIRGVIIQLKKLHMILYLYPLHQFSTISQSSKHQTMTMQQIQMPLFQLYRVIVPVDQITVVFVK